MSVWVKICGLTNAAAVDAALDAGADAIGFVFAPSPRQISPTAALALKRRIDGRCACVAVMRHPSRAVLEDVVTTLQPDFVQTELADVAGMTLPAGVAFLPVLRENQDFDLDALPPQVLFEGARSGVGELADWPLARAVARRTRMVLAGGLDAGNVAAASRAVQPYGVDVSSGVEAAPGRKDARYIHDFVAAARAAGARPMQHQE